MIKKIFFLGSIVFQLIIYCQETIQINFKPAIKKKYEYTTQFLNKTSRTTLQSETTVALTFSEENNGYKVFQEFKDVQVIERDKLLFSLDTKTDSLENYRLHALKKFLTKKNIFFNVNKQGVLQEQNILDFFKDSPYLRKRDKTFFEEYIRNLNFNRFNFWSKKEFTVGETFTIPIPENSPLRQAKNFKVQLIKVLGHKAIFKFDTEFYTAVRNRNREIVGKTKNNIHAVLVMNTLDGTPLQMRMLFKNDDNLQLVTQHLKGEQSIGIARFQHIRGLVDKTITVPEYYKKPNSDSLKSILKKYAFATKNDLEKAVQNINPFTVDVSRYCARLGINIAASKKSILVHVKHIKAFDISGNIVYQNDVDSDFELIDYEHPIDYPLSYKLCDMPVAYFTVDAEFFAYHGGVDEILITKENAIEEGVFNWIPKEVEVDQINCYTFFNEEKNEMKVDRIELNYFSSTFKEKIPLENRNKDIGELHFLFTNLIDKKKLESFQVYFNTPVTAINKLKYRNKTSVTRTFKLPVKRKP